MSREINHPRQLVAHALRAYFGEPVSLPNVALQTSNQLTFEQVAIAVQLLKLYFNLPSGNSGGRNLYELLSIYLRDSEASEQINDVMRKYR